MAGVDEAVFQAIWQFNAAGLLPTVADIASRAFGLPYADNLRVRQAGQRLESAGRLVADIVVEDGETLRVFQAKATKQGSKPGQLMSSALQSVASHGSVSYGRLPAARLEAILKGANPSDAEKARVHQGMSEMPLDRLHLMAWEIGMEATDLDNRSRALFGMSLEELTACQPGKF